MVADRTLCIVILLSSIAVSLGFIISQLSKIEDLLKDIKGRL